MRSKDRRTGWSAHGSCRRRNADAEATSCVRSCVCKDGGSFVRSRPQQVLKPVDRGGNLGLLDSGGGIDIFGAYLGAGADESAFPDALVAGHHLRPSVLAAVAGIESVAVRPRQR